MRDSQTTEPFRLLGKKLREMRVGASETLAETSGAVEIAVKDLVDYELGRNRPSEETLLMLINHFNPQDKLAISLWSLAGYTSNAVDPSLGDSAIYTDIVEVYGTPNGLTLDFKQSTPSGDEPSSVSRVGMSRQQAATLMHTIALALAKTDKQAPRYLPPKLS